MRKKPFRNYIKLINDFINLNVPFEAEIIGHVIYHRIAYPILKLGKKERSAKYQVVIQAGVHGEEAVSIRVLYKFLKELKPKYLKLYNFVIFPCLNPYGYSYNIRHNRYGKSVNDGNWKKHSIPELNIIGEHYPNDIDLFIDIHADCGSYGKDRIYAYERVRPGMESVAKKAFKENKKVIPYMDNETIYREYCNGGVIFNPNRDNSIQDYMSDNGCDCAITLEIPGRMKGINRIIGSVRVLRDILKYFDKEIKKGIK